MGKVKRARQKYHQSLAKNEETTPVISESFESKLPPPQVCLPTTGLFANVPISYDTLISQTLPEFEKIPIKSLQNEPEKHIKKKDKRQLRRETFLRKIEAAKQMKLEAEAAKKRRRTAVVGDMRPLADALPTLQSLADESEEKAEKKKPKEKKHRSIAKASVRHNETVKSVTLFRQVLNRPEYKADPYGTIKEHLTNLMKEQNEEKNGKEKLSSVQKKKKKKKKVPVLKK